MSVRQWREHLSQVEAVAKKNNGRRFSHEAMRYVSSFPVRGSLSQTVSTRVAGTGCGRSGAALLSIGIGHGGSIERGVAAERALIGKLALANIAPESAETQALLHVLDELRGIPMAQFGEKTPVANLHAVIQALDAKTSGGSLLLNTENHSMLVSKVAGAEETSYRFYDPNFGLYAFARIDELHKGIQGFCRMGRSPHSMALQRGPEPLSMWWTSTA